MENAILLYRPSHRFTLDIKEDLDVVLEAGINWVTWQESGDEPHCHAACYNAAKKEVVEAMVGIGVRVRPVSEEEINSVDSIWYAPGLDEAEAAEWLYGQVGRPYAEIDLFNFLLRRNAPAPEGYFCSMLACEWRRQAGAPLFVREQSFKVAPGLIYISRIGRRCPAMPGHG